MKIILYCINFAPDYLGSAKYNFELAEALAEKGHELHVITTYPYYPEWKNKEAHSLYRYKEEQSKSIRITRCPVYIPSKVNFITRIIHLCSFSFSSFPVLIASQLQKRSDWIVVILPTIFSLPFASFAKILFRSKLWIQVHDFELSGALGSKIFKSAFVFNFLRNFEKLLFKGATVVSALTPQMITKLSEIGVPSKKHYHLPLWLDLKHFEEQKNKFDLIKELNIPRDKKLCLYSGNIGQKQGLEIIIETARLLEKTHPHILFLIFGTGAAKERLELLSKGLSNLQWRDLLPSDCVPSLYSLPCLHLLPQLRSVSDQVFPSKLLPILASQRPLLVTCEKKSALHEILQGRAKIVEPENLKAFSDAILEYDSNPLSFNENTKKGFALFQNSWNKKNIIDRFDTELQQY